jgi:hypothetical protein
MINRITVSAILAALCLLFVPVRGHALPPPEFDRQIWLKWGQAERTAFVKGWIAGVRDGKVKGCFSGLDLLGETARVPDNYGNKCFGQFPKSLTAEIAVNQVTAYYLRYSEPRGVTTRDILNGLIDGKTIEAIHLRH